MSGVPVRPKIYHIVHVDRLPSIIADGYLWCDAEVSKRRPAGTMIGIDEIKHRRLTNCSLTSHPGLYVGECVPFYFCPRSVMLYLLHRSNHSELAYRGGQGPIIHLEADLHVAAGWAAAEGRRWAFTLTNAGSYFFEDRADLKALGEINWSAVEERKWQSCKEAKQAEFLMETSFPWSLVERIGVHSATVYREASNALAGAGHRPAVEVISDWYYEPQEKRR